MLCEALAKEGFSSVFGSNDLVPGIKLLERSQTTVANAYLHPVMSRYLDNVSRGLDGHSLQLMNSSGGWSTKKPFTQKIACFPAPPVA